MFKRILIANRGEIACRIIATCRKLGVQTVAVYSDADAGAIHVTMADQAVRIGPASVAQSYLCGDVVIQAALDTGAEAIHPGYGFLSENAEFAKSVGDAGLAFIGPTPDAIRAMGLKDAAKVLMQKANVPVVPGYHGHEQDADFLADQADQIGYPVLIKARAGGGGKGMRLVQQSAEFKASLAAAQREGQASFGDPHCLIEKFISQPRHIEMQVFGDGHGNVVHLFERDCSLQRRHQKVIEEAPAPNMPIAVRTAMGDAAVAAAKAIGYVGAGTIEFIVDGSGPLREDGFWFMEMNTRLQVEHPVTEAITGLDLVALQLQVAAGHPIPFSQHDLAINGWSVEARLYAEDVPKGFLPAAGPLHHLKFPAGTAFDNGAIRIDTGVAGGDEVSPHYDPMIAKVICHAPTREQAFATLAGALAATEISGLTTNRDFLAKLCVEPTVLAGQMDTGLIERTPELTNMVTPEAPHWAAAAIARHPLTTGRDPFDQLTGFALWAPLVQQSTCAFGDDVRTFEIEHTAPNQWRVGDCVISRKDGQKFTARQGNHSHQMSAFVNGRNVTLIAGATSFVFHYPDPLAVGSQDQGTADNVLAPMTGVVKVVSAVAGQSVEKGQPLIVLEAMKMEHSLTAPRDGLIAHITCKVGDQVGDASVLVQLEISDE